MCIRWLTYKVFDINICILSCFFCLSVSPYWIICKKNSICHCSFLSVKFNKHLWNLSSQWTTPLKHRTQLLPSLCVSAAQVGRLLAGEDVFSALDGILERINDLQQLVSSWSENLSEDDCQRGSTSSSMGSLRPSSPSQVHLEVQYPDEEEEEEEVEERSCEKGLGDAEEQETRSQQTRSR